MEIKREKSECFPFVDCAFCFGKRNLKYMFENYESTSKYSSTIMNCFDIQLKRVSEDLKICEICIERLRGALEFKHKLDRFIVSKQSTENVYKDNCSSDYSNLKLAFVVKNECLIDDCSDLESPVSELESESGFECNKNTKSSASIDFQIDKSDSKTESPDKKPNGKNDKIHLPIKSPFEISKNIPSALVCFVCKEEFKSHTLLLQHYPNHNLNYICDVCGDAHVTKTSLIKHLSKHFLKRHPCKHCKNFYASKCSLYRHIQLQHKGIGLYVCRLCPERFSSDVIKNKHQTEYHGIPAKKIKKFDCTVCNKKFTRKANLDRHFITHKGVKTFECTVCNKNFTRKENLDRHFITHKGEKNFECTVCNKKFYRKCHLNNHIVIHSGEKKFACTVCNKTFLRKTDLHLHFVTHTGEKDFECTMCNKKYFRKSHLKNHFIKHKGEKNFKCTVCNKKFFRKYLLDYHIVTHTGEKNFECDICSKSYAMKQALATHMRIHTNT